MSGNVIMQADYDRIPGFCRYQLKGSAAEIEKRLEHLRSLDEEREYKITILREISLRGGEKIVIAKRNLIPQKRSKAHG